jgi:hypothetical protein
MAKSKHDELADALSRMHEAEAEHEATEESHGVEPAPEPVQSAQPSPPARPTSPQPRPATPAAPPPPKPVVTSGARQRPSVPGRAATPAPGPVAPIEVKEIEHDELQGPHVESSSVKPQAPRGRSAPRPTSAAAAKRSVEHKRTMIPILLTIGVILMGLGVLRFVSGSDSPFSLLPVWFVAVLIAMGLASLGLAALNMSIVKHALEEQGK